MASMHFLLNVPLFLFLLCKVTSMEQVYLVKLTIGGIERHLVFDTEIPFTWMSCFGLSSTSLRELRFTHPLCQRPDCNRYPDIIAIYKGDITAKKGLPSYKCNCEHHSEKNQVIRGVLSNDIFQFTPTVGKYATEKKNIAFVCGGSTNVRLPSKAIGVLGMGFGSISVPSQYSKSFSYCLPGSYEETAFLQFDVDMPRTISRPVFSTPILRLPGKSPYYLKLTGISVGGERLNIPPETFDATPSDGGYCFVDTGSPFTQLVPPAYNAVKDAFVGYFEEHKFVEIPFVIKQSLGLEMCYTLKGENYRKKLEQTMVLHFEGADFVIGPSDLFVMYDDIGVFCVALSWDHFPSIGNYQQRNKMFVFDLERDMLHFYPQDCSNLHLQAIEEQNALL